MTTTLLPEVQVRELTGVWTAAVRLTRTFDQLGPTFAEALPQIAARIAELGGAVSGPPYARYHAINGDSVDIEVGAPVMAPIGQLLPLGDVEPGQVGASSLPAGHVAVATHTGPYSRLGAAWARIDEWLEASLHHRVGAGWEIYVDSPDEVPSDQLRTEVVVPIN